MSDTETTNTDSTCSYTSNDDQFMYEMCHAYMVQCKDLRPVDPEYGCICVTDNFEHTYNMMYGLANKWMLGQPEEERAHMHVEYTPMDTDKCQFARVDVFKEEPQQAGWFSFGATPEPVRTHVATVTTYVVPLNNDTCNHVQNWLRNMPEYNMPPYVDIY